MITWLKNRWACFQEGHLLSGTFRQRWARTSSGGGMSWPELRCHRCRSWVQVGWEHRTVRDVLRRLDRRGR